MVFDNIFSYNGKHIIKMIDKGNPIPLSIEAETIKLTHALDICKNKLSDLKKSSTVEFAKKTLSNPVIINCLPLYNEVFLYTNLLHNIIDLNKHIYKVGICINTLIENITKELDNPDIRVDDNIINKTFIMCYNISDELIESRYIHIFKSDKYHIRLEKIIETSKKLFSNLPIFDVKDDGRIIGLLQKLLNPNIEDLGAIKIIDISFDDSKIFEIDNNFESYIVSNGELNLCTSIQLLSKAGAVLIDIELNKFVIYCLSIKPQIRAIKFNSNNNTNKVHKMPLVYEELIMEGLNSHHYNNLKRFTTNDLTEIFYVTLNLSIMRNIENLHNHVYIINSISIE